MMSATLGNEIRRLRTEAKITLRQFAGKVGVSPAHQSDVEHDRRRPSPELLQRIAHELRHVGAEYPALAKLATGLDESTRDWASSTPGVREMLRKMRDTGYDPRDFIKHLESQPPAKRKKDR